MTQSENPDSTRSELAVEREKIALERERLSADLSHRAAELAIAEREIALREKDAAFKESQARWSSWSNPLSVALVVAAIGALGNAWVANRNGELAREQEKEKAEYARVLEMIKVGDPDQAAANMEMLLKSGLYADFDGKLKKYLDGRKKGEGGFLPVPASPTARGLGISAEDISLIAKSEQSEAGDWMRIARKEIGVEEIPGPRSNPRILEYQRATGIKPDDNDEWDGSFMCWSLKQVRRSCPAEPKYAAGWANWGTTLPEPRVGAIVITKSRRRAVQGLVGFYVSSNATRVRILGGNVGNRLTVASINREQVVSYRWPPHPANELAGELRLSGQ